MTKLATLDEPQIYPPRRFLMIVWIITFLVAIYGIIATPGFTVAIYAWSVISVVAVWQLWTLRWVELNNDSIRTRNIFRHACSLRWDEVTEFKEEEVRLNKGTYTVLRLSNEGTAGVTKPTKIALTNDQQNFTQLRDIVRNAVPRL